MLSSLGITPNDDEYRRYKTSAANHVIEEAKQTNSVYIPQGIDQDGEFLHEGDDNADVNCETLDGKGTFHVLLRTLYQNYLLTKKTPTHARIKKESSKSLKITPEIEALTSPLPYNPPKVRPVPPRTDNALAKIKSTQYKDNVTTGVCDMTWVMLRMLCRGLLPKPNDPKYMTQVVSLWRGYNTRIIPQSSYVTKSVCRPVINHTPSDKSTLYTSMKANKELTNACGQEVSVQSVDLQLYIPCEEIVFHLGDAFKNHFTRMGGFHGACSFNGVVGMVWGSAGLKDLFVDSGTYAEGTTILILMGKEFNRGLRFFVLGYETFSQLR